MHELVTFWLSLGDLKKIIHDVSNAKFKFKKNGQIIEEKIEYETFHSQLALYIINNCKSFGIKKVEKNQVEEQKKKFMKPEIKSKGDVKYMLFTLFVPKGMFADISYYACHLDIFGLDHIAMFAGFYEKDVDK